MPRRLSFYIVFTLSLLLALAGCAGNNEEPPSTQTAALIQTVEPAETPAAEPGEPAAHVPTAEPVQTQNDVPDVAVTVINVGYGDAILVQLGGQSFLIDTGEKQAGLALLRALALRGVKSLDSVFLTHMHNDHIGGLETAAQRYEIGTLYAAGISQNREKADKLAAKRGLKLTRLSAGDTVKTESGAVFEVLGPVVFNAEDDNDNSLVLRLEAGGLVWLFTGDMQFDEEQSLMKAGTDLKADVLKVGNHGNPDATSKKFAKAVSPAAAVISTSTEKDDDSANPRVIAALGGADIFVTQDFALGVLLTAKGGVLTVEDPQPQAAGVSVSLDIDTDAQTVTLTGDRDTDLSGWLIWSEKGGELFVFPQGSVLKAGRPLTVACRGNVPGDFLWNQKKVWSDQEGEAAVLVTNSGAVAVRQPV